LLVALTRSLRIVIRARQPAVNVEVEQTV